MDRGIFVHNWDWAYFVLGLIASRIVGMVRAIWRQRKEERFLKRVSVMYPGSTVEVITVSGSNKEAVKPLEKTLRREDNPLRSYPKYHRASEADRTVPYSTDDKGPS